MHIAPLSTDLQLIIVVLQFSIVVTETEMKNQHEDHCFLIESVSYVVTRTKKTMSNDRRFGIHFKEKSGIWRVVLRIFNVNSGQFAD